MDELNGIGLDNKLPWNKKKDMKYFAQITKGSGNNAILMGKNTWLSIPKKPLVNRYNIILSNTQKFNGENYNTYKNFDKNLFNHYDELWIIGGEKIYNLFINDVTEIHISRIKNIYNCDTFFPKIPDSFKLIEQSSLDDDITLEIWRSITAI